MSKAGRTAALLTALALVGAMAAVTDAASPRPPKNLKKVGDHWTPWTPPQPAEGDYIIEKDDTFWDLSGSWQGDPYLWPQIWEQNRYVLDSHWIYPGDPLKRPASPTVVPEGELPPVEEEAANGHEPATPAPVMAPIVDLVDAHCSGSITPEPPDTDLRIVGRELEREHVAEGDVVYLSQGRNQGLDAGDELAVVRTGESVVQHPDSKAPLGRFVRRLGKVRVLAAQADTAIGVIVESCDAMHDGDQLLPWEEDTIPRVSSFPAFERYDVEPTGGTPGTVVAMRDDITWAGTGHVIYTDLGSESGVEAGDVIVLYREGTSGPRRMLGQAVVFRVDETTSAAKIIDSVREVGVGDEVESLR